MNERNLNRLIVATAVLLVVAICFAGPFVFAPTPFERSQSDDSRIDSSALVEEKGQARFDSTQLATLKFQEPVTLPAKTKRKATKVPPPAITVSDTFVGSRTQMATVVFSGKKYSVEPGDTIGTSNATVHSIAINRVTVTLANGERHTYTAPLTSTNGQSRNE